MKKECTKQAAVWKTLLYSKLLQGKNRNHKIAYIAVITALLVVTNMFFEFKFMDVQFSLTIAMSALSGLLIGPLFGFIACFLGDLVGFLYNSGGYTYMPWVGLSLSLTAAFSGLVFNAFESEKRGIFFLKASIVCLLSLLCCTIGVNTTAFWLLYSPKTPYMTYLIARLFAKGQIFNCLFNYALIFVGAPALTKLLRRRNNADNGV